MQKERVEVGEKKLIGITIRTNNADEMNPDVAKIATLAGTYWSNGLAEKIPNRSNLNVTFSVYTDFDSDETGEYTYLLGEEVNSIEEVPEGFTSHVIPAGHFQRFTTAAGKMPNIVIDAWKNIWQMTPQEIGGQRQYHSDYELYDQRAADPNRTILDIFIGVK